jgi:AcrR family transcriptional regulator
VARPVDADSAQTWNRIIAATLELLDGGADVARLSTRKVAERAGLSPGTLQYYFATKDDLFEACLEQHYERLSALAAEMIAATTAAETSDDVVEGAARRMYRFVRAERAFISIRVLTNATRRELHPARQPEFLGTFLRQVAQVLSAHVGIAELDVRLSLLSLSGIYQRLALLTEDELFVLTAHRDEAGRKLVEDFAVRAAVRLLRPGGGAR